MIRVSASAVPRLLACPGSAHLPHADYRTEYADAGTEHHAELEAALDLGDTDGLHPDIVALIPPGAQQTTEAAFAYDVATDAARALGHGRRAYRDLAPYEIPGTADLVVIGDGRGLVVDHKSYEEVEPADRNTQTATYALMLARAAGLDEVTVAINYKMRKPSIATLDVFDLDAHAARLKKLHADVDRAAKAPREHLSIGKHCKYCPAFLTCPRQQEFAIDVGGEMPLRIEQAIPFNDDKEAADAFDLWQRIKMLSTRIGAALHARAAERPIPLHDGRVMGQVEKLGNEKLDGDIVYQVIKERHGQAIADAAVIRSATKKRIKEALAFAGGPVAKLEREALDEVRKRGGSKRETKLAIEIVERKELAAAE